MKCIMVFFGFFICTVIQAQTQTKKALFLGNSYTSVNNLPQMVADVAASTGDLLLYDSNTPGGYTLQGHSTNTISLSKISNGNWDYVVLQEQSQLPSFPIAQVQTQVFPYAQALDSIINAENPCAETVFYMTWGRENGDASNCAAWPPVCTYSGMDSLLNLRYRTMADTNDAILSPVGAVWNYLRQHFPSIDLYQADGSHPTTAGTYAAACSFYTALFRKDPTAITFDAALSASDAADIRNVAKLVVYDSLANWHIGEYDPLADFSYSVVGSGQVAFTNNSTNAIGSYWSFGDGTTSTNKNPIHHYSANGTYMVELIADKCGMTDDVSQTINITSMGVAEQVGNKEAFSIYPNPVSSTLWLNQSLSNKVTYKIVSIEGREIKRGTIHNFDRKINVSSLSNGMYFLQLFDGNTSLWIEKFVKNE